jgi:hypothetical protein
MIMMTAHLATTGRQGHRAGSPTRFEKIIWG